MQTEGDGKKHEFLNKLVYINLDEGIPGLFQAAC